MNSPLVFTIYCHVHVESGRRYVGLTKLSMTKRWNSHVYTANRLKGERPAVTSHFANAIRKYGKDAFSHEVLETAATAEEANDAEKRWIDHYDTRNPEKGFNLAPGGAHAVHPIRNPWDRPGYREMATAAARRRWDDPDYRQAVTSANVGKKLSPETKAKLSEKTSISNKVRRLGPDVYAKIGSSMSSRYASRTSISCKRHGNVPLSDCYKRKSRAGVPGARLVCKACVHDDNLRRKLLSAS